MTRREWTDPLGSDEEDEPVQHNSNAEPICSPNAVSYLLGHQKYLSHVASSLEQIWDSDIASCDYLLHRFKLRSHNCMLK